MAEADPARYPSTYCSYTDRVERATAALTHKRNFRARRQQREREAPRPWQTELWEEVQEPAGVFLIDGID